MTHEHGLWRACEGTSNASFHIENPERWLGDGRIGVKLYLVSIKFKWKARAATHPNLNQFVFFLEDFFFFWNKKK